VTIKTLIFMEFDENNMGNQFCVNVVSMKKKWPVNKGAVYVHLWWWFHCLLMTFDGDGLTTQFWTLKANSNKGMQFGAAKVHLPSMNNVCIRCVSG
jgi:hypothetical protein